MNKKNIIMILSIASIIVAIVSVVIYLSNDSILEEKREEQENQIRILQNQSDQTVLEEDQSEDEIQALTEEPDRYLEKEELSTYNSQDGIYIQNSNNKTGKLILKSEYESENYYFEHPSLSAGSGYLMAYKAFFSPNSRSHYRFPVVYNLNSNIVSEIRNIGGNLIGEPQIRSEGVWSKRTEGLLFISISQSNLDKNFILEFDDKNNFEIVYNLLDPVILNASLKVNCAFVGFTQLGDISPNNGFIARLCNGLDDFSGDDYLVMQELSSQRVVFYENIHSLTNLSPKTYYYDSSENIQWLSDNIFEFTSRLYEKETGIGKSVSSHIITVTIEDDGQLDEIVIKDLGRIIQ